ncbi:MAG: hypothetical protein ACYC5N_07990, partial [Endomicrobiales bacterium]
MNGKKLVSLITLVCFLFSSVFAPALQAAAETGRSAAAFEKALDGFLVPPTLGRITGGRDLGGEKVVVNIQDLHCHAEAQRNISQLLSLLDRKYRLKTVFVEGAYGEVDTSWLAGIKDKALQKEVAGSLLEQGKLTGTEYYSALSSRPRLLKGMDDKALHQANLRRLGRIMEKKGHFEAQLKVLSRDLQAMEARYFNAKNKKLSDAVRRFRCGELDARKYYTLLGKFADAIQRSPDAARPVLPFTAEDCPNMKAYLELVRMGQSLRYKRISRELQ